MQCYNPRLGFRRFDNTRIKYTNKAWSSYIIQSDGQAKLKPQFNNIFTKHKNIDLTKPLKIPCGKCDPCRLNRAGETAKRAYDEYRVPSATSKRGEGERSSPQGFVGMFITLTYDQKNLPSCGHFDERDIVLFVKRLRKISPPIRTLGVAEYGENSGRAHFHLLVFGHEFSDKKHLKHIDSTHSGHEYDIYTSQTLTDLWPLGKTEFGSVTEQSCSYVARYMFKKNRKEKEGGYCETCKNKKPEKSKIVCRSRRPGLGAAFCDRFVTRDRLSCERDQRAGKLPSGDGDSLPRYYVNRVCSSMSVDDRLLFASRPDFEKQRDNERKERLDAEKIINKTRLRTLYKTKI